MLSRNTYTIVFVLCIICLLCQLVAANHIVRAYLVATSIDKQWMNAADSLPKKEVTSIDTTKRTVVDRNVKVQGRYRKANVEVGATNPLKKDTVAAVVDDSVYVLLAKKGRAYRVRFRNRIYDYILVDLEKYDVNMHLANAKAKKYNSIAALLSDTVNMGAKEVLMVTNAGMYTELRDPQGLYIEKGKELKAMDTTLALGNDNFHLQPNGVFFIDSSGAHILTSQTYRKLGDVHAQYATQSGPMLVIDGKIHPKFTEGSTNLNIRSGVGLINNKKLVFAISNGACNFFDFALLFKKHLHCMDALYLDGAISLMYLPDISRYDKGGSFGPIISVTEK